MAFDVFGVSFRVFCRMDNLERLADLNAYCAGDRVIPTGAAIVWLHVPPVVGLSNGYGQICSAFRDVPEFAAADPESLCFRTTARS